MTRLLLFATAVSASAVLFAADAPTASVGQVFEGQIRSAGNEIVSLAEAMPAELYNFAPTQGEFKGVRTFSQQMTHIATVIYEFSAAALGEKCPVETGKDENGSAAIQGKEAVVKYLKASFAYGQKAANALTGTNMMDVVPSPFAGRKSPRISLIATIAPHSFDHYGQAVEYARMNRIIPPASR